MRFMLLPPDRRETFRALRRAAIVAVLMLGLPAAGFFWATGMPGRTFRGAPPELTASQSAEAAAILADVDVLASDIGPRHLLRGDTLARSAKWIEARFVALGLQTSRHTYTIGGTEVHNVVGEFRGGARPEEIVVVGAHYDSVPGTPGADDNASGVAGTLALARRLAGTRPERTIRFVAFVNEEPPWFATDDMGSVRYARHCRDRGDDIRSMISLESIGYFDDAPGSQKYPPPFAARYPDTGNFVAFVGNLRSSRLTRRSIRTFRHHATVASEGVTAPGFITGLSFSDHRAFWEIGVPAVMVTGTAMFRNPHYHRGGDATEVLDGDRLWRVVDGLEPVVRELAIVP